MNARLPTVNTVDPIEGRYHRAEILMQGLRTQNLVQNDTVLPNWIEKTDCFWYARANRVGKAPTAKIGKEFRLVDAIALTNDSAFDHAALTAALAKVSAQEVNAEDLPISRMKITLSPLIVCFTAFGRRWQFDGDNSTCTEVDLVSVGPFETLSPDGKQVAFARDNNLWARDTVTGEERALTEDGEDCLSYAATASAYGAPWQYPAGLAGAQWSPDSQRLFVVQRDNQQVNILPLVNHLPENGSLRPTVELAKVAYPGDEHVETYRHLSIEVASGRLCEADYRQTPVCPSDWAYFTLSRLGWWASDCRHAYFIDQERGDQIVRLVEFDTNTGTTRVLFEESNDTYINVKPDAMDAPHYTYLPDTNELIWWSERSGWGHLYLYDLNSGELKHAITSGNWRVRDILYVDTARRELWIQTAARVPSRNPYYRDICRVHIDTGELTTVLSTDHEYDVHEQKTNILRLLGKIGVSERKISGVSPGGDYVVTTRSRVDQVPVSLLLNRDGDTLMELESADVSNLPENWQWPEPVKMLAADGNTDIYGVLFRPSDYAEDKKYPVINLIVSCTVVGRRTPWQFQQFPLLC